MTDDLPGRPVNVSVSRALPFAAVLGYRPLELDLYRPAAERLLPAVVYLHGGGWRQGTRDMASPAFRGWRPGLLTRLASAGFLVVTPDYRLSGEAQFPAQLEDVHRALDWVIANGAEHGADPACIMLWGDSAGGHLAALAAMGSQVRPQIRAVVAWYPITDLKAIQADAEAVGGESHNTASARETALLGGLIQDLPDKAWDASPVSHVSAATAPFFVAHGTADLIAPYMQSVRLRNALQAVGKDVILHIVEGAGHMWQGASHEELKRIFDATVAFLRRHSVTTEASRCRKTPLSSAECVRGSGRASRHCPSSVSSDSMLSATTITRFLRYRGMVLSAICISWPSTTPNLLELSATNRDELLTRLLTRLRSYRLAVGLMRASYHDA